jgi:hypothetical protein
MDNHVLTTSTPTSIPLQALLLYGIGRCTIAVGHHRTGSNNMTNEGQVEFTFEGNATITVQSTEMILTIRDTGQGNVTFLPGGGVVIRVQFYTSTGDGTENAAGDITEYMNSQVTTGIGVTYFSTASNESLAPLNNMVAVFLDEIQPNEGSIVRFFEWKSGSGCTWPPVGNGTATSSANNTSPVHPMS